MKLTGRGVVGGPNHSDAARWRERIAHHEAAHVVANLAADLPVYAASIKPRDESAGTTATEWIGWVEGQPKPPEETVRGHVVSQLAGYAASLRFDPTFGHDSALAEAADDFANARKVMWLSGCSEADLLAKAVRLVETQWPHIQMIARGLLLRTNLTGDEMECLLGVAEGDPRAGAALVYHLGWAPADVTTVTGVQLITQSAADR